MKALSCHPMVPLKRGYSVFCCWLRLLLLAAVTAVLWFSSNQMWATMLRPEEKGKASPVTASSAEHFETDVLPIFKANCVQCHGAETRIKEMNLSSFEGLMKGSESGPVVVPGKPEESRLYKMVHEGLMPPGGKTRLSEEQVAAIRAWINAGAVSSSQEEVAASTQELTQHDIIPIMLLRCTACHGLRRQEAGLDLRTKASMLKGGQSGPAVISGKPEESLLIRRIRSGEMPPKKTMLTVSVKPITAAETDKVARWIAQGAPEGHVVPDVAGAEPDALVADKDRQFWAFQPPGQVQVPSVRNVDRVRNSIDGFILSKLEEKSLTLSPEADRLTLMRRAYFDLTGLPPEPGEVEQFLADRDSDAYENLVDRLLASPRYGERWGRYWLDLAGYADSEGGKLSADHPRPYAYRYRDYVIRSINADKPYDQFLLEQIAGDELVDYENAPVVTQEMMDNLIATGFLRMGPDSTSEREVNFAEDRLDVISDEIDVLSSGVMGLTIKCAKCHSHKYDPIPQRDYYRLAAIFKGAYDEHDWLMPLHGGDGGKVMPRRYLPYITPGTTPIQILEQEEEREAKNRDLERQIGVLKAALEQEAEPFKKKLLDQKLAEFPPTLREDLQNALAVPPDKRNQVQKYLAEKFEKILKVEPAELKYADAAYQKKAEEIEKQMKLLEVRKIPEPKIQALWDRGVPSPTYILRRGDSASFGRLVGPGVPSALTDGKTPFESSPPWPGAKKTGRRLAMARWLMRPDHPLTARVMVNRIWMHHFGVGIVKTPANFGSTGARPTHPELLDWLATEFVRQGWSLKTMHRLMMTSTVYRQSSTVSPILEKLDPENQLLSRMPLKRMEAEALYDSLLLISGRLDETRYGVPQPVLVREDGLVTPIETENGWRRGIYVAQRRTEVPTVLENFDLPPMSPNCVERNVSTVAPQALNLLNNEMIQQLAGFFAERVKKEAGSDPQKQIERAYWIALSRPPSEEERRTCLEVLNQLGQSASVSAKFGADTRVAAVAASNANDSVSYRRPGPIQNQGPTLPPLKKLCHVLINSAAFLYID